MNSEFLEQTSAFTRGFGGEERCASAAPSSGRTGGVRVSRLVKAVAKRGADVDASTPMVPDDKEDVDGDAAERDEAADSEAEAVSASDASTGANSKASAASDDDEEEDDEEPSAARERPVVDEDEDDDDEDGDEVRAAVSKRPLDQDEDDEDDEDDEGDDDDEDAAELARRRRVSRRAARLKSGKKKRKKKRVKRPPLPKSEAELNSPNRSTTVMIWSLVGLTLLLWGFARTACNFNPPQVDKPKLAELDVLAREPKDAAIEFELRLREHRFEISEKLAAKPAEAVVAQAKSACGANCPQIEHGKILCLGAVMERAAADAKVRVGCSQDGKWDYQLLTLVRDAHEWRISARESTVGPPPVGGSATAQPTGPATAPGEVPSAPAASASASAASPPIPKKPAPKPPAPPKAPVPAP